MALDIDLDLLKDNLFDAAKDASEKYVDTAKESYKDYKRELREYTDNLAQLKMEIAEASTPEMKAVKLQSIELQQRAINSLVDRYQMIMTQEAAEQLKEVLITVAKTVGKIALSLIVAAI